jgi:multidrug resistance protein
MKKNIPLSLIFLVVFVDLLGFGLLIPILPTFSTQYLSMSETDVGIVIAVYSLIQFLFNPVFGTLSDKYGRRRIILITLFTNASGYLLFAFADSYLILLISRIICGIGGSSIGVAQAYIADVTTKEERSKGMGLIGVAFGLGFVFGPMLGGTISHFGYHVVGYSSAIFSLLAFSLSLVFLPESRKEGHSTSGRRKLIDLNALKDIINNPSIGIVILMFFVITFSVANIYGTMALLGTEVYNFTDMENGFLYGIVGIIGAAVQGGFVGRLSKKYSDNQLITFGSFFLMIGLGLLPFGANLLGVAIIGGVLSVGTGILQPVLLSLISKVTSDAKQGTVLGLNQSFSAFARMLGPLWGGFSFEYLGYQIPFLTGAFFTFFIFIFSTFYLKKHLPVVTADNEESS